MATLSQILMCGLALVASEAATGQTVVVYEGLCDASAAVAIDAHHFVVADDEQNTLLVYRRDLPKPVATVPLAGFLGTAKDVESDLEGAALIGKRIYWIGSHGRNKNGKEGLSGIDSSPPICRPAPRHPRWWRRARHTGCCSVDWPPRRPCEPFTLPMQRDCAPKSPAA